MSKFKEVSYVALLGIIGNIILLFLKLSIGLMARSQAMIADGLNSAGDVFASFMTYIGNKIAESPGDEDHPYGHGKAEYIFSMIISFSLLIVSYNILKSSIDAIIHNEKMTFSITLVIVSIITIVTKFALFMYSNHVGRKHSSLLALANAADHRNDIALSALTLISILLTLNNIYIVDAIVGILIAIWIAYTAFDIFSQSYVVLMDTNIDENIMHEMEKSVNDINGVDHIDTIHAQPVGLKFILIVEVSIDAHISVYDGHEIASLVKKQLMTFNDISDAIIHVNPAQFHP